MRTTLVLAVIAVTAACFGPATVASADGPYPTYDLDVGTKEEWGGFATVSTAQPLTSMVWYVAEVSGTVSHHKKSMWTKPGTPHRAVCGTPEDRPMFYSDDDAVARERQGRVGIDAETIFARPCSGAPAEQIGRHGHFRIVTYSLIGGFHYQPATGQTATPLPGHRYEYILHGEDQPAMFGFSDNGGKTWDNYGRLRIRVRPATPADCAGERWRRFYENASLRRSPWDPRSQEQCELTVKGYADRNTYFAD